MKRLSLIAGMLLVAFSLAAPALSAKQSAGRTARSWGRSGPVKLERASASPAPKIGGKRESAAAMLYRSQGYMVPNQAAYERAKAAATARAGGNTTGGTSSRATAPRRVSPLIASGDPDIHPAWTGINDPSVTPPDSTGAIGPSRYIELVNTRFGIYDRSGNVISVGGLQGFVGANTDCVTDPQIIWDPQTNRFYYVVLEFSHYAAPLCSGENPENRLYIGFSRTASPTNGTSSWCKYFLPYFPDAGDLLPDYPKLGDNSKFLLIGSNVFDNATGFFLGADVAWVTKPGPGTSCPDLPANHLPDPLLLHDGSDAFTPVPANQTDTANTGYVVATPDASTGPATFIDTYPVSTNFANPIGAPVAHNVPAFAVPPFAPQPGTAAVLDTLDGRLTQAVSAVDPSKMGKTAIWTQHTVAGGAGSEARWYEIEPVVDARLREGTISDGSLFVFNAAISPDRKVSGSTKRFGDAFVVGFNTSSAADFVRIQMVSQWADNAMSQWVEVKASPGFNDDFTCNPCRWGDYSGATPDPAANPYSNHGRVWLSNQWNVASEVPDPDGNVDWRTYNWGTNPAPFAVLNAPTATFQKATSFTVSWFLGNQASLADVRFRAAPWNGNFDVPNLWKSKVPAGSAGFPGTPGRTYCFSAQSYDDTDVGPRAWGFGGERCTVVPLDDRSLSRSAGWSRGTGGGFFKNTFTRSSTFGSFLTRTGIHAKTIQVMVEKCPTCGNIRVYWNGVLKRSFDLRAARVLKKVYLHVVTFGSVQTGTLRIVVSSSGEPVIIDAVGISAV